MKSVDANFGGKVWKDFCLTLAQNLSVLLLAYFQNRKYLQNYYIAYCIDMQVLIQFCKEKGLSWPLKSVFA